MDKPLLSICMIVKNEQKNLVWCLDSFLPIIHREWTELIIVDTGSKDATIQIAKKYTDRVYSHKWKNDFSKARNYSISKAKGDKILIIDADERLDPSSLYYLERFILNKRHIKHTGFIRVRNFYTGDLIQYSELMQPRIFYNDRKFHYEGVIHNKPKIQKSYRYFFGQNIIINHYGYVFQNNKALLEQKRDRSLPLLLAEYERNSNNFHILTHLLKTFYMLQDWDNVIKYGEKWIIKFRGRKFTEGWFSFLEGFLNIVGAYINTGKIKEAEKIKREAEKYSRRIINMYIMLGYYYAKTDNKRAIRYFEHAVKLYDERGSIYEKLLTSNADIMMPKILNYLANHYFREGKYRKAGTYLNRGIILNNNRLPLRWDIFCEKEAKKNLIKI